MDLTKFASTSVEPGQHQNTSLHARSGDGGKFASSERPRNELPPLPDKIHPRVSVIIVTYGSSSELPDCLHSLLNQSVPVEIFLVDNASPDNTAEVVSEYAKRYKNVHAILNAENIGLAAGNN